MFLLVSLLWLIGVLLLRKNKVILGYAIIVIGWALSVVADVMFSTAWDRGFGTFFIGLVFVWFVQKKMGEASRPKKRA